VIRSAAVAALVAVLLAACAAGQPGPRTPIEDPENVDARRAAAGLGTLAEYYEEIRRMLEEDEP
jgi:hypothetical protein